MKYRSCVVVLVGSETASRPWIQYEIEHAWKGKYEKQCFINYRNNPTPQNYLGLIDYVRDLRSGNSKPYYNLAESAEYRTTFDLGPIFDCY